MKNILKSLLIFSLFIACSKGDDTFNSGSTSIADYPYLQQVGYSANDILSNNTFSTIYIEVMYVNGFAPTDNTLNNFKNFIEQRTYKTNVIVEKKEITPPVQTTYSIDDIRTIEDDNRTHFSANNQIALSAIFINGASANNTSDSYVLGTAYRNTSFVIFEESVQSFSDSQFEPSREVLESTVVLHEFGHLLGLVNVGTTMVTDHQDTANGAHCTDQNCLMYYKAENGSSIGNMVSGGQIPQLDSFCLEDLKANGGR
ncbi:MAG: membrane metalloprotease [Lutibacter sp.]|uniref:membrane metalloprotease n=1 Tax=Lutibacter sp. TaxID=1925666 RepID=UPI00299EAF9C|nr:membrane metalloprotease [Lutibacter sp.]MDX1829677.1 membrane metalloprotease [Lutibacter sp.]